MKVYLNDTQKVLETETSVSKLLDDLNIHSLKGTAIAINGEIIPADKWGSTVVKDKDQILMIEAVQGG